MNLCGLTTVVAAVASGDTKWGTNGGKSELFGNLPFKHLNFFPALSY
jgi:hypothetical protein